MDKTRATGLTILVSTGVAGLVTGAYKGYCGSQNIPISPEINVAILGVPTALGVLGLGGFSGIITGNDYREQFVAEHPKLIENIHKVAREDGDNPELAVRQVAGMASLEDAFGGACGGALAGGALGATTTTIGYGLGYLIGNLSK